MTDDRGTYDIRVDRITTGSPHPGLVLIDLPNDDPLELTPRRAAQLGLNIIRGALSGMEADELNDVSTDVSGLANYIDDYARAIYCCPRCGLADVNSEP